MQSAQAMATEKVAEVSQGLKVVSISSSAPPAEAAAAPRGAEESKGRSAVQSGAEEGEDEDDVDEDDPLWKVSSHSSWMLSAGGTPFPGEHISERCQQFF